MEYFRFRVRRPKAGLTAAAPVRLKNGAGQLDRLLDGYKLTAKSEGRSRKTISWVTSAVNYFVRFLTENGLPTDIARITASEIRRYIVHLQQKPRYSCHPFTPEQPELLSEASVNSYVRALQSLWAWLVREGFLLDSPFNHLRIPVAPFRIKPPLSREQIAALLSSCDQSDPIDYRDYLAMFLMYDSGPRAGEVCGITLDDIDLEDRQIKILGKGNKERRIPIGVKSQKAIWKYNSYFRPEPATPRIKQLFLTDEGYPLKVDCLQDIVKRHAKRAGISGIQVSPHAFRRSFAIDFLKNGGDLYTLKTIMGHTSISMLRAYLMLAQTDVAEAHARCSPGDNLDIAALKRTGGLNPKPKGGVN